MLDTLKKEDFSSLEPQALAIEFQGQRIALSVTELRDLPPISPRQTPFAIILQGPPNPLLPQGVYALQHPQHGQLDLFMVPISRGAAHAQYEVIFN